MKFSLFSKSRENRPDAVKAAVIGAGYLGNYHAEKYAGNDLSQLLAVVDTDLRRAEKCARRNSALALNDYRQLPGLGIKCASVASSTMSHFEVTSYLLSHGVDVLVEKPMTVTLEEADKLIQLANKNSCILQVGHLERFNPAFCEVEKILTSPLFFEVRRIAKFAGRGHDVDVVLDLMIHDIDIVAYLVKRKVERIEAIGVPVLTNSVDIANARVTFEGGAVANFTASRAAFKSERSIRIFQPNLYVSLDFGNKKFKVYSKSGGLDRLGFPEVNVQEYSIEDRDALKDEINSFLLCVKNRTQPKVTGEDGFRALELAHNIRKAFAESEQRISEDLREVARAVRVQA